ncbi:MAG TPA: AMP-binding protein [Vineibacter sp.]|nr:AMP-binding protein [Vineibacter sp.]
MTSRSRADFPWLALQPPAPDLNGPSSDSFAYLPAEWSERSAIDLLRVAAHRWPDRIASDDGECQLTYGEMWAAICRAARMIDRVAASDAPVGVLLPNDATYQVAVLACVAAGRPCVMLDRGYPADRNAEIIRDARVTTVFLTGADVRAGLAVPAELRVMSIDDALRSEAEVPTLPDVCHRPDAPAFIIYTSGSTGRPKGVALSQRAVLHRAFQKINASHQREGDALVSLNSPCTITGLAQIFETAVTGATLMKLDLQRLSLGAVLRAIADRRPAIMSTTPPVWRAISRLDEARTMLSSLRIAVTGGDVLLQADLELMRRALPPDCSVLSAYGATEASTMLQWHVPRGQAAAEARVAAGYPMSGFDYAVVDEDGNAAAEGEAGELVVRSRCTAIGGWRDGQLHPGPFMADPQDPTLRIYPTGDLVRIRADGVFVTLGRKDRQLKILGNRIEPAEIENALRQHPAVLEAAVVARRNGDAVKLLAFVVAGEGAGAGLLDVLGANLRGALPSYMQPTQILSIDSMPLLPGRKVDQARLLAIAAEQAAAISRPAPTDVAATRQSTDMVAQAWRRVMDRQSLQADLSFAEAGGDSLRLLEFIFHLEQKCGVGLPLEAFNGDMRPSELAASLDQCLRGGAVERTDLPCVVLLPGYSGDEPRLAQFRADCAQSLRFVTISYPDWATLAAPGTSYETVVADIVQQIETACGSARLMIAGYSMGGDFAYAAATKLAAAGREVGLLAVLDTDAGLPSAVSNGGQLPAAQTRRSLPRRVAHFIEVVRHDGWEGLAAAIGMDQRVENRWFLSMLRLMARLPSSWVPAIWLFRPRRLIGQMLLTSKHSAWCRTLEPVRHNIPTVLIRSEERRLNAAPDLGWSSRCAPVDVIGVRGDHRTMFDRPQRNDLSARFMDVVVAACGENPAGRMSEKSTQQAAA